MREAALSALVLPAAEIRRILWGLLVAIFISAIDQTMVSIALLSIVDELGGAALVAWVVSGFLIASTIATPIYGKLSDLYGRKRLMDSAILISLAGALLSALSRDMPQLIGARVLQGIGAGGLVAVSQAVIADLVAGPERGRYQGYFSGVYAIAAVLGPVVGGMLTHFLSWRALFLLNLPLGVVAFLMTRRTLRRLTSTHARHRIDYLGAALLTAGLSALLIQLTRIGQGHGWMEPGSLLLFGLAATLLAICAWVERRAVEPILPPALFGNRAVMVSCMVLALLFFFLVGMTMMMPLAMQALMAISPSQSALRLIPLSLGIPVGAFCAGQIMARTHRARPLVMLGVWLCLAAMIGIVGMPIRSDNWNLLWMCTLGVGLGLPLPTALVIAQMAVPTSMLGLTTAATLFFRSLGGAIGGAVMASVLLSHLDLREHAGQPISKILSGVASVPGALEHAFRMSFLAAAGVALLACIAAFWLPRDRPAPSRGHR